MIKFTQDDFNEMSAECINNLSAEGLIRNGKGRVSIPIKNYPGYILHVERDVDQKIGDNCCLLAIVQFNTKDSSIIVGAAGFENQEPTEALLREAVKQGLNSFADTYNAIEKGEKPKPWPGFGKSLSVLIAFATAQSFLREHINGETRPKSFGLER